MLFPERPTGVLSLAKVYIGGVGKKKYMAIYIAVEAMTRFKDASRQMGVGLGVLTDVVIRKSLTEKRDSDNQVVLSKAKIDSLKEQIIREALRSKAHE